MKTFYIYMMANNHNNILYIGVTNNLIRRAYEHKSSLIDGFSKKYNCHKLVWYEQTNNIESAVAQKKRLKKWKREYKENVIQKMNPEWKDLYFDLI